MLRVVRPAFLRALSLSGFSPFSRLAPGRMPASLSSSLADSRLHLMLVICAGAILRVMLISGYRFHPDEALYATWARLIASGKDIWLAQQLVDKPPLNLYILAGLFGTLGASEEIARIPNILFSIASIALLYDIAKALYHDQRVALVAAGALALSPLAILFSPTAFMDPPMLCWLLAASCAALRGAFGWSGLFFGLSLATKQDAVVFSPLLLCLLLRPNHLVSGSCERAAYLSKFGVACVLPLLLVACWSFARPQTDFLSASLTNYGGLNFAPPNAFAERLLAWMPYLSILTSPFALIGAVGTLLWLIGRYRNSADLALAACFVAWLALHTLLIFPTWDRYMLPLAPLAALLVGRAAMYWLDSVKQAPLRVVAGLGVILLLAVPARAALANEIHAGRDFNLHAGVDQLGEWFWATDTTATIMYVHDLSWEMGYYTFGRELDRRWMPAPADLADDAARMPLAQRLVVLAEWEPFRAELSDALARRNLKATVVYVARRADTSAAAYIFRITPLDMLGEGHPPASAAAFFTFTD
jgi:hypothetical protein